MNISRDLIVLPPLQKHFHFPFARIFVISHISTFLSSFSLIFFFFHPLNSQKSHLDFIAYRAERNITAKVIKHL